MLCARGAVQQLPCCNCLHALMRPLPAVPTPQSMEATRAGSVNAELDLLAALMKVGRPGASDNFKLNLFGDGAEDLETSGAEAEQVGCWGLLHWRHGAWADRDRCTVAAWCLILLV